MRSNARKLQIAVFSCQRVCFTAICSFCALGNRIPLRGRNE